MTTQAITNLSCAKFSSWGAYAAAKRIASNWTGIERGRKAATSLKKQRELLQRMHAWLEAGQPDLAQSYYAEWKKERASYLVLIGWY